MFSRSPKRRDLCAHEDCGASRFHVGEDGFTYCDQGHQQSERGTVIAEDTGELVQLGRKSRKKDSDAESATSRASSFSGSHAFEHYLLCVQLILRKQVHWLIDTQKLPNELEALVKDLWALRLQNVQNKVGYESEAETEAPSSQVFSSQSDSEATSASRSTRKSKSEQGKVQEGSPGLVETLALCHIGLLFLRMPVTVGDILQWTNEGRLLFYRAAREVPLGMRERLPPRYQAQLEPQQLLASIELHRTVLQMVRYFNQDLGMSPPLPNVALIIYRWVKSLMTPLEVYAATYALAELLAVEFDFQPSTKSSSSNGSLQFPEVRLMAVIVVATKLLFPFDGMERCARSDTDLSAVGMDWTTWSAQNASRRRYEGREEPYSYVRSFSFDEEMCNSASDDRLDAYLDWYEDNIATEDIRQRGQAGKDAELRRAMFTLFPNFERAFGERRASILANGGAMLDDRPSKVRGRMNRSLDHESMTSEEEVHPFGSNYRRFRDVSELFGVAKAFYERAAGLAGLPVEDLAQAVFAIERKMQTLEDRLRRQEAG